MLNRFHNPTWALILLITLTFLVRGLTIGPSVIDHDESTYIIIADQLLRGYLPYVDNLDIKPIGIYLIFAVGLKYFGHSIESIRVLTIVTIALSGFFLFLAKRKDRSGPIPLFTGLAYVLMMSIHEWTWSGNTEIYFNLFTCAGVFILMKAQKGWHLALLGTVMGMGFMIKYLVLFDLLAFFAIYVLKAALYKKPAELLLKGLYCALGFAIPIGTTMIVYQQMGFWDEFFRVTFILPGNYASMHNWHSKLSLFLEYLLVYLPLTFFYFLSLISIWKSPNFLSYYRLFALVWFLLVWVAILLPGKEFHHYMFQAIPPTAFFMFDFLHSGLKWTKKISPAFVLVVFGIMMIVTVVMQTGELVKKTDYARKISEFIKPQLGAEDEVFVLYHNIIYFLMDRDPQTIYIHPTLLVDNEHGEALDLDQKSEMDQIFSEEIKFVIVHSDYKKMAGDDLAGHLKNYDLIETWDEGKIECYRKKLPAE
jgi:4-amino-4-deoxy-L-arabinose transferase-like glycosyltransferase